MHHIYVGTNQKFVCSCTIVNIVRNYLSATEGSPLEPKDGCIDLRFPKPKVGLGRNIGSYKSTICQ